MNEKTENDAYDEQEKWIRQAFGRRVAESANYGWGVDEFAGTICTKIYGHGYLTTDVDNLMSVFEPLK